MKPLAPKLLALLFGLGIVLFSSEAFADDPLPSGHVELTTGPGQLVAPGGKTYYLPLGTHILDGTTWQKLDDDTKTSHDQVTRLTAENQSLKKSLEAPSWTTLIVLGIIGIAAGGVVYYTH